jgi:hypothetical protein
MNRSLYYKTFYSRNLIPWECLSLTITSTLVYSLRARQGVYPNCGVQLGAKLANTDQD